MSEPQRIVVIPCHNESRRLEVERLLALARDDDVRLLFVDDGSTDRTLAVIRKMRERAPDRIAILSLERNVGKAEAVRRGMLRALRDRPAYIAYFDADLSTPPDELLRLFHIARTEEAGVVLAARVALLGREIHRSGVRHYLGRAFATAASLVLRLPVYDTQCGAKVFEVSPALEAALEEPFCASWAFDVELLGRLLVGWRAAPPLPVERFVEVPLHRWRDVPGSHLRPWHMAQAAIDLGRVGVRLDRARRGQSR